MLRVLSWYYIVWRVCFVSLITVKKDVDSNNEEAIKEKEQAILELGSLLSATGQAEGWYLDL